MIGQQSRFRGQGIVEFSFVAPVFLLLFLGTIELGWAVYTNHTVASATREGARFAMVNGQMAVDEGMVNQLATVDSVQQVVNERSTAIIGDVVVTRVQFSGDAEPGDAVTIETRHDYEPLIGQILGFSPFQMRHETTVIVQY